MRSKMEVAVYAECINYLGEVTDSVKIAEFRTMDWARRFIDEAKKSEDELFKIRVEVK